MRFVTRPIVAAAILCVIGCSSKPKTPPPPPVPPVISSFTASASHVHAGEMVTLSYQVQGATALTIVDQNGATVATPTDLAQGTATVTPTETSFYLLKASGEGGKDSAFVQVAVDAELKDLFLIAVPREVDPGQTVTLMWSALHGTNIRLSDDSGAALSMAETGTLELTPTRSTRYTLSAKGPSGTLMQDVTVTVHPLITSFTADPAAAKPGGTISLHWNTVGTDSVVLSEDHFGQLFQSASDVDPKTFDFVVPTTFTTDGGDPDAGVTVPENYPLHFTLTASTASPAQTVARGLDSITTDGPIIHSFDAPPYATQGQPVKLGWTVSANRVQLLLDGNPVFETVPPAAANGSFTLPAIAADTVATLVAYDYHGLQVSQSVTIHTVTTPSITSFTVPGTGNVGQQLMAKWTTTGATRVVLREQEGATLFTTVTPAMVTSGSAQVAPTRNVTWVLDAYNAAGDHDHKEASIVVSGTAAATYSPDPAAPGVTITLGWDVSLYSPTDVVGIPSEPPMVEAASNGFIDLFSDPDAHKLYFADTADGTATFTTPFGFNFPFAGSQLSTFTAGVNGFLAPGSSAPPLATNVDLKGTMNLPPPLIAPFWDDLDLGSKGQVLWKVVGDDFPRALIVQWDSLNAAGDAASNLTFQLQLEESGAAHFIYHTLTDTIGVAQGQTATVGIYAGPVFAGQSSYNSGTLAPDQEQIWFTNGPITGTVQVAVGNESFTPGFFYRTASGGYTRVGVPVRVFGPKSVLINEVMPYPSAAAPMGQWAELYNPSALPLDVSGLKLIDTVTPMPDFLLPPMTSIPAHGYLVLGTSTDATDNDGAGVTVPWGGLTIGNVNDGLTLVVPPDGIDGGSPFTVDTFAWTSPVQGTSEQVEPVLGTLSCVRDAGYGSYGQIGSPGALNPSCFGYTVNPIAVAYEDISGTGTPQFSSGWDDDYVTVTLPTPFTYFQMPQSSLTVSTNGWITFSSQTSSYLSNKTTPDSYDPLGTVAPFWDDMHDNPALTGPSNVFTARATDHFTIQWSHVTHYNAGDDLNFELKLFDNGNIEVHYASMVSGSTSHYADGNSATVWIENPAGEAALPVQVEAGTIQPNTAYRFTPSP